MKKTTVIFGCLGWTLLFVVSCLTINIYFPEAAVKKTADEIVDEVRKTDEQEKTKKEKQDLSSSSFSFVAVAYAQEAESVSTPKIRALKQSLSDRFPHLVPFFDAGNIGEGNDGYLQVRNEEGLALKDKASLRRLVKEENSDRESLYTEVAGALDIDPSQIQRVQKIFAKSWIRKSRPGWWIQREDGQWVRRNHEENRKEASQGR